MDASIIIPTYNERENIVEIVGACSDALSTDDIDYEIVVVDDDSPDETWRLACDTYAADERVRVIRRTETPGLGEAVERGFREARGEIVAVIDADFQHPPSKLPTLIKACESADVAIGSRFVEGGGIDGWPRHRHLISWGGRLLARFALDRTWKLSDPMSGFFAVRRELVAGIDLDPEGYKILLEVIRRTAPERVCEIPYTFRERAAGESNLDTRETLRFIHHMIILASDDISLTQTATVASALLILSARPVPSHAAISIGAVVLVGLILGHGAEVRRRVQSLEVDEQEATA